MLFLDWTQLQLPPVYSLIYESKKNCSHFQKRHQQFYPIQLFLSANSFKQVAILMHFSTINSTKASVELFFLVHFHRRIWVKSLIQVKKIFTRNIQKWLWNLFR